MVDVAPPRPGPGKPDWAREGRGWPNAAHSRFVRSGGIVWHVQMWGDGPPLLLLHGTGASTHSWRGLAPLLAERFTLIVPDLPGHGFTQTPGGDGLSLAGMARLVAALLGELGMRPELAVGHSAGAAVAVRMAIDGALPGARALVSINGALLPFPGFAQALFPGIAKLLFLNPLVPRLFTLRAGDVGAVARFLERTTGSRIAHEDARNYARLFGAHGHVAGALGMMANWDLVPLERDLPKLDVPLALIVGERDAAVPPSVARRVQGVVRSGSLYPLVGLGHLAHEERPDLVAAIIDAVAVVAGESG